jgi:hypothetical protein
MPAMIGSITFITSRIGPGSGIPYCRPRQTFRPVDRVVHHHDAVGFDISEAFL